MARAKSAAAPHADDLGTATAHFNDDYRHRYRLQSITAAALGGEEAWREACEDLEAIRGDGIADASCALIARAVVALTPRYAIGMMDGQGGVVLHEPGGDSLEPYLSNAVLLVNPLGGLDNWAPAARWFKRTAGENAHRRALAGLASERRPDPVEVDAVLAESVESGRAVILPPDEGYSIDRAIEVGFIYGVEPETLRSWKRHHRGGRASGQVGRPSKNR